ncbi:unnamed protein product [Mytilus coruscus]|uniref:Chromo domain-containing protein n=1 Tax=Mytilus coruscus TaxID=42192 RepID=A0A6J8BVX7_MYTCO|nr:unnamed protein product [Mytilus coruscus]
MWERAQLYVKQNEEFSEELEKFKSTPENLNINDLYWQNEFLRTENLRIITVSNNLKKQQHLEKSKIDVEYNELVKNHPIYLDLQLDYDQLQKTVDLMKDSTMGRKEEREKYEIKIVQLEMQIRQLQQQQQLQLQQQMWNQPQNVYNQGHSFNSSYSRSQDKSTNSALLVTYGDDVPIKGLINVNRLKKFYDSQDRPTNNVDVPTDDEMSDDEDNEEKNDENADEIVQTDTQPDSNDPIRNDTQVQRHTNDDRNNDDSDLYLVERIVKAKRINNKMHYYIKWLGFGNRSNSWEPEESIPPELRHEFKVRMDQTKCIKARKTKR